MIPSSSLDIVLYVLLLAAFVIGFRRGFIAQLVSLLGLFLAWLTAYLLHDELSPWIAKLFPVQSFAAYEKVELVVSGLKLDTLVFKAAAFIVIFLAVKLGLTLIGSVLSLLAKAPGLNLINRWAGAALALAEAAVLILIAVHVLALIPSDPVQTLLADSAAAAFFLELLPSGFWSGLS